METDPAPVTSQSLAGLPGFVFSQAIGLVIGASHGAAEAGAARTASSTPATSATRAAQRVERGRSIRRRYAATAAARTTRTVSRRASPRAQGSDALQFVPLTYDFRVGLAPVGTTSVLQEEVRKS